MSTTPCAMLYELARGQTAAYVLPNRMLIVFVLPDSTFPRDYFPILPPKNSLLVIGK